MNAQKINQAITETQEALNSELRYSEDLQNSELVEFYKGHLIKLNEMA